MIRASVESRRSRVTRTSSAPRPLIVPANTSSPGLFFDGQRLAGHGRLIDVALAAGNLSVERNLLARPDDDDVADDDRVDGNGRGDAVTADDGFSRGELHQAANGAASPIHRARFQELRKREEKDDGGGFAPLAENGRTSDRHQHEDIDVESGGAERCGGPLGDGPDTQSDGEDKRQPGRRQPHGCELLQESKAEQNGGELSQSQAGRRTGCGRLRLLVLEPGSHAGTRHGFRNDRSRQLGGIVLDAQPLPHHVGIERLEAGEALQAALEDRDLLVAVHALDLENRLRVQLADATGGHMVRENSIPARVSQPA